MDSHTSRFRCASSSLMLRDLLKRARGVLWSCFVLAIAAHIGSSTLGTFQMEKQAAKPLTTRFVKREPRLTKPLELKKRPRLKRRRIQRKMVAVKARMQRGQGGVRFQPGHVLGGLVRPTIAIARVAGFRSVRIEPRAFTQIIEAAKEPKQKIDMGLELLDIEALDTGKYHALVIQDPTDKRNITGFFHFVRGYSKTMRHIYSARYNECEERQVHALRRLANYINECTDIKADFMGVSVPLDSEDILKVPWIYLGTHWPVQLTASELQHLGRYLVGGGFLFTEPLISGNPPPASASFRNMFTEALAYEGIRDRAFERIPNSHPIYHCYFDFPDGPPMGAYFPDSPEAHYLYDIRYLEGLFLEGGRLVGMVSHKWYASPWGDWGPGGFGWPSNFGTKDWDPTRPLQFGVNLLIFALTQEGSITHRLMESVR